MRYGVKLVRKDDPNGEGRTIFVHLDPPVPLFTRSHDGAYMLFNSTEGSEFVVKYWRCPL